MRKGSFQSSKSSDFGYQSGRGDVHFVIKYSYTVEHHIPLHCRLQMKKCFHSRHRNNKPSIKERSWQNHYDEIGIQGFMCISFCVNLISGSHGINRGFLEE
jgi:hypothetical protein